MQKSRVCCAVHRNANLLYAQSGPVTLLLVRALAFSSVATSTSRAARTNVYLQWSKAEGVAGSIPATEPATAQRRAVAGSVRAQKWASRSPLFSKRRRAGRTKPKTGVGCGWFFVRTSTAARSLLGFVHPPRVKAFSFVRSAASATKSSRSDSRARNSRNPSFNAAGVRKPVLMRAMLKKKRLNAQQQPPFWGGVVTRPPLLNRCALSPLAFRMAQRPWQGRHYQVVRKAKLFFTPSKPVTVWAGWRHKRREFRTALSQEWLLYQQRAACTARGGLKIRSCRLPSLGLVGVNAVHPSLWRSGSSWQGIPAWAGISRGFPRLFASLFRMREQHAAYLRPRWYRSCRLVVLRLLLDRRFSRKPVKDVFLVPSAFFAHHLLKRWLLPGVSAAGLAEACLPEGREPAV